MASGIRFAAAAAILNSPFFLLPAVDMRRWDSGASQGCTSDKFTVSEKKSRGPGRDPVGEEEGRGP